MVSLLVKKIIKWLIKDLTNLKRFRQLRTDNCDLVFDNEIHCLTDNIHTLDKRLLVQQMMRTGEHCRPRSQASSIVNLVHL